MVPEKFHDAGDTVFTASSFFQGLAIKKVLQVIDLFKFPEQSQHIAGFE